MHTVPLAVRVRPRPESGAALRPDTASSYQGQKIKDPCSDVSTEKDKGDLRGAGAGAAAGAGAQGSRGGGGGGGNPPPPPPLKNPPQISPPPPVMGGENPGGTKKGPGPG
eukprot:COSAG04_NODE_494_length_13425_cov_65.898619_16_plen_109_part_01